MEYIRTIKITIYVDTNKQTYNEVFEPFEYENTDDFLKRVCRKYRDIIGDL